MPQQDRAVSSSAVRLLQQLSSAQDFRPWRTAVQKAGLGCFALTGTDHVAACTMGELGLFMKAASNSLALVLKDNISVFATEPLVMVHMMEVVSATAECIMQVAIKRQLAVEEQQQLLGILSESGSFTAAHLDLQLPPDIDENLAFSLEVSHVNLAARGHTAASLASARISATALEQVVRFSTAVLQLWAHLSQACINCNLGAAPLKKAIRAALKLAAHMPALIQKIKPAIRFKTASERDSFHAACVIAIKQLQLAIDVAMWLCQRHSRSQSIVPQATIHLVDSDELLKLLLMALGWKTHSCHVLMNAIQNPEQQQQQQQQQHKGTPPHQQLLSALGATWAQQAAPGQDQLDGFLLTCGILQCVLHGILFSRCSGSSSSSSSSSESTIKSALPEHLQLPLLKVLLELAHLESQIRAKKQLGPFQARDLFLRLDLMNMLVKLISSPQDSSSSSGGSSSTKAEHTTGKAVVAGSWPVLPAVVAAALLKPVMQQLSVVVLTTLNSSSSTTATTSCLSTACSSSTSSSDQTAATAPHEDHPSTEDDRRGVTFCFGNLLISLCLSVEPRHLAAALVPDVLTPITLLEATLRAQAIQIAPAHWPTHDWLGAVACAMGSSSSSSQGPRASLLDLQHVASQVLETLLVAIPSAGFQAAIGLEIAASAKDEHQSVLLLKLFTLCLTCLKTVQAAAATAPQQEETNPGLAEAAAAAAAAFGGFMARVHVQYASKAHCIAGMATEYLSSSSNAGQPYPAALLPCVVLIARGLHVYLQQMSPLLQQQCLQMQTTSSDVMPSQCDMVAEAEANQSAAAPAASALRSSPAPNAACFHGDISWMRLDDLLPLVDTFVDGISAVSFAQMATDNCASLEPSGSNWPLESAEFGVACSLIDPSETVTDLLGTLEELCKAVGDAGTQVVAAVSAHAVVSQVLHLKHCVINAVEQLNDVALSVCASIPLAVCCNNPDCHVLDKLGESQLVGGKECVCGGCGLARYCCGECQKKHWSRHKQTCRLARSRR